MKSITTLAVAALATLGLATQASAVSFSPKSTAFTAKGPATLTKGATQFPCKAFISGRTDSTGVGHVFQASFTGSADCRTITAAGLPWRMKAHTLSRANILGVTLSTSQGACGPGRVKPKITHGDFRFKADPLTPDCIIDGSLSTSPRISIVP